MDFLYVRYDTLLSEQSTYPKSLYKQPPPPIHDSDYFFVLINFSWVLIFHLVYNIHLVIDRETVDYFTTDLLISTIACFPGNGFHSVFCLGISLYMYSYQLFMLCFLFNFIYLFYLILSPFVFINWEIVDYFTTYLMIYQRWLYFRIMVSIACFAVRTRECHRLIMINCVHAAYSHFLDSLINCCYSTFFLILRSNINCEG